MVIWLTGLSGSGKSTLADRLAQRLREQGTQVFRLDGDVLREGLCADLGYSLKDRRENARRAGEVARILADAGVTVVASFMTPLEEIREALRTRIGQERFILVHVDCPLDVCEERDVKGLYQQAREGKITDFVGIDLPFDHPQTADVTVETHKNTVDVCADTVLGVL